MVEEKENREDRNYGEGGEGRRSPRDGAPCGQEKVCETKKQEDPTGSRGRSRVDPRSAEGYGPDKRRHQNVHDGASK